MIIMDNFNPDGGNQNDGEVVLSPLFGFGGGGAFMLCVFVDEQTVA
jgi:hypothetical protein